MKKKTTTLIIISLMFGIAGIFWFLAAKEELNMIVRKKLNEQRFERDFKRWLEIDGAGLIMLENPKKK